MSRACSVYCARGVIEVIRCRVSSARAVQAVREACERNAARAEML